MLKYYDTKIKEVIAKKLSLTGGTITDGTKEMNITPDGITGDDSQVLSKFNKLQASQFEGNIVTLLSKNSAIPFYLENIETNLDEDGVITYKNEFRLYDDNKTILKYVAHSITNMNSITSKAYESEGFHIVTPNSGNKNNGCGFHFNDFTELGISPNDTIIFSLDVKGSSVGQLPYINIHFKSKSWFKCLLTIYM